MSNCGLHGQISYAGAQPYNQQQGYSDATKVSYNSVALQPAYSNAGYNQQQSVTYQSKGYAAQYSPGQYQSYNNYIQSPVQAGPGPIIQQQAYPAQIPQQQQQQQRYVPYIQYSSPQTTSHQQQSFSAYNNNYGASSPSAYGQYGYSNQQSVPVQNTYQSVPVQPLQQQVIQPVQKTVSVQHFPARLAAAPVNNNNNHYNNHFAAHPKNAHHYPAAITKPANLAYQTVINHVPAASPKQQFFGGSAVKSSANSLYRTSFSVGANPLQQTVAPAPFTRAPVATVAPYSAAAIGERQPTGGQVIQSGPYFTQTVYPTGGSIQSRPSSSLAPLATNPINIPSAVPIRQTVNVQQPQQHLQYNQQPSTAVSHVKFQGMGVSYEW